MVYFDEPGPARGYPQIFGSIAEARAALIKLRMEKPETEKPEIVYEF